MKDIDLYMCEDIVELAENKVEKLFDCAHVDWRRYMFTVESVYSVTPYKVSQSICKQILHYYNRLYSKYPSNIVDATANIGGNTIAFSQYFKRVYAVEIKSRTSDVLSNNVKVSGAKNVSIICDDFKNCITFDFLHNIDVIFIDPPWYSDGVPNDGLSLDSSIFPLPIDDILIRIRNIKKVVVALKVPKGYSTMVPYACRIKYRKMDILLYHL